MLYFRVDNGSIGWELWKSDGTEVGTVIVQELRPGVDWNIIGVDNTLYFSFYGGDDFIRLWKIGGTDIGTVVVKNIYSESPPLAPFLDNFTAVGSTLYFSSFEFSGDRWWLWKSDGTDAGTVKIKEIQPGSGWNFTAVGNMLYFSADDGTNGEELWKSDGTAAGTVLVKDIRPGSSGAFLGALTAVGSMLYFSANDGATGRELWKSDGTDAGTEMVKDINPNFEAGSNPVPLNMN